MVGLHVKLDGRMLGKKTRRVRQIQMVGGFIKIAIEDGRNCHNS